MKVNSEGYPSYYDARAKCFAAAGRCRPYLRYFRRVLSANWMSLCCGIGNYVWKLQEVRTWARHQWDREMVAYMCASVSQGGPLTDTACGFSAIPYECRWRRTWSATCR